MRLKTVRLAGFKSFVDPTAVHLRARLAAVVGPNGCGKSNIVDAVRWVLGESSARQLRGGELADVIFNGSATRAPAGRASVELVFDNTEGRIAGPYARYAEVSVRRELVRDGDSQYYLNGSRCRRRDVVDLFLGTGLGPRSYAIIEQGMIARLVDARPDELRAHLEEVAGISRYRERRRETEARIADTRENLARLTDVRGEIGARLATLERQVKAAQRFRELRERERALRAQHLALRLRTLNAEGATRAQALSAARVGAGAAEATAARNELALAAAQDRARAAMEALAAAQQAYYAAGAEVARIEQAITQAAARARRAQEDHARARADVAQLEQQLARTDARLAQLRGEQDAARAAIAGAAERQARAQAAVQEAEAALEQARSAEEHGARQRGELGQGLHAAQQRAQDLDQRVRRAQARQEQLAREAAELGEGEWATRLEDLEAQLARRRDALSACDAALEQAEHDADAARANASRLAGEAATARATLAGLHGRIQAERAAQQAALHVDADLPAELADAPLLADSVHAQSAWRTPLEVLLGPWLRARVVADLPAAATAVGELRGHALVAAAPTAADPGPGADWLATRASADADLADLLAGVRCAQDLNDALARRADLRPGESYVTPQGHRVLRAGVLLPPGGAALGVLDRAEALADLEAGHAHGQAELAAVDTALAQAQSAEQAAAREHASARAAARAARDEVAELTAEHARAQAHGQRVHARAAGVARERAELAAALAADQPQLEQARAQAAQAEQALAALGDADAGLADARRAATEALARARGALDDARRAAGALEHAGSARAAELRTLDASRNDWQGQLSGARARLDALASEQAQALAADPALEHQRQAALSARVAAEAELGAARRTQEAADHAVAQANQARAAGEQALRDAHAAAAAAGAALGETQAREGALREQFGEQQIDAEAALAALPADAAEAGTRTALEDVERSIARLGAVNLAAPDEQRELAERADYLTAQNDDLTQALSTLEQSMARMDRETRARFKDTFDAVNAGLGRLFPRLFGGGEARLELAEDDPLDAGVLLIARPPGKRNASVHALSGGEKALTAIALVFALFELNPAPFCMLDEVDAPLDEHNVLRFGELVREMAARVQFVLITHNRASMEMASELAGVTMSEPGVSRLVTVDLEEAAALAGGEG